MNSNMEIDFKAGIRPKLLIILFKVLCLSAPTSAATWDFRSGDVPLESWLELWTLETPAALAEKAFRIDPQPGLPAGVNDAFILEDVYDSSRLSEDDRAGTPIISSKFDAMRSGKLLLRAGTTGTQNQNATITLLAKGRPLLILKIINNHEAMVISGTGEEKFYDAESWFNRARDYVISWGEETGTNVVFETDQGTKTEARSLKHLAPGYPDEIRMQVGFGRATGKALRIEVFTLLSVE